MEVSATEVSERLENNDSGVEMSDSWLGGRSISSREFVKELGVQDGGMCLPQLLMSSASTHAT